MNHILSSYPVIRGDYILVAPFSDDGSLPVPLEVIEAWIAQRLRPDAATQMVYLVPPGFTPNRDFVVLQDRAHLQPLVAAARDLVAVTCVVSAAAAATSGKRPLRRQWWHIQAQGEDVAAGAARALRYEPATFSLHE